MDFDFSNAYSSGYFLTFCLIFCATLFFYARSLKLAKKLTTIHGPPTIPFLGNIWTLRKLMYGIRLAYHFEKDHQKLRKHFRDNGIVTSWIQDYPDVFRIWLGFEPYIIVSHPKIAKHVLGVKGPNKKSLLYKNIHPWLHTGLLTSFGAKWQRRRKLITPTFHAQCLQGYFPVFLKEAQNLTKTLGCLADSGKPFHVYRHITHCTLDIIMECAFGQSLNAQQISEVPYVQAVYGMLELTFDRILKPWQWPELLFCTQPAGFKSRRLCSILHSHTRSVIERRKKEIGDKAQCFLDMLLLSTDENGNKLSDDALNEEVDTFMFEGHDTTSAGITWCLYMLGCHPHVQEKLHEELDTVLCGQPISPENISRLKYLSAVIKESLRILPPVPFFARHVEENIEAGDVTIPADIDVMIPPMVVHHNERVWEDSWKFDPDRFYHMNADSQYCAKGDSWSFIPFSAGPRNCIGQQFAMMEMSVTIATLLQGLTLTTLPNQTVTLDLKLILRPKDGKLLMEASRRNIVNTV